MYIYDGKCKNNNVYYGYICIECLYIVMYTMHIYVYKVWSGRDLTNETGVTNEFNEKSHKLQSRDITADKTSKSAINICRCKFWFCVLGSILFWHGCLVVFRAVENQYRLSSLDMLDGLDQRISCNRTIAHLCHAGLVSVLVYSILLVCAISTVDQRANLHIY